MEKFYVQFSGYMVLGVLIKILGIIFKGLVVTKLWAWFVVPTFDLPEISIPVGIGFAATVYFLTFHADVSQIEEKSESKGWGESLVSLAWKEIIPSVIYLCFGGVVRLFV